MALLRAMATVGGYTMASRVLGFVRDVLVAALVGAGPLSDAFFVAFKLPNLFRRLFAEGAFSAAFVPIFARRLEAEGRAGAMAFAGEALAVLLWALVAVTIAFELAMPWIMVVLAPGFTRDQALFDLTVALTRLTFPYLLLIALGALLGAMLNAVGRFAAYAASPILLNLCLILPLLWLPDYLPSAAHVLAWSVPAAGIAQLLYLAWAAHRAGLLPRLPRPRLSPSVRQLLRLIGPAAFGAGVMQVNVLVDTMIATLLPAGAVSYLYYADRVTQLPLGVIGVAVGTALLPLLSRQLQAGNDDAAMANQNRAVEISMLLTVPAAVALVVLAQPITVVLFQRGAFGADATAATAAALAAFALGLPAFVLIKALTPGFFARHDTATPVMVALLCLVVNVALNLALMGPLAHVGLALATSVSAWLNAGLLSLILKRRGHFAADARLKRRLPRLALATLGMALGIAPAAYAMGPWFATADGRAMAALAGLVTLGLALFGVLVQLLGAAALADLATLRRPRPPPAA